MLKLIALLLGASLLVVACGHAKEGDPCTDGAPQCFDPHNALFCESTGLYKLIKCPGPQGCKGTTVGSQAVVQCDTRGTQSADPCMGFDTGFVECDRPTGASATRTALVCNDIWRRVDCPNTCESGVEAVGGPTSPGNCN
jgi:hypothetical protein